MMMMMMIMMMMMMMADNTPFTLKASVSWDNTGLRIAVRVRSV
jgi:hypothetical protein